MNLPDWDRAYGEPPARARLKSSPEAFRVDELLAFEPDGEGQHQLLHIEKRLTNTDWLARQLARFADVPPRAVSYAGLKDRHALTTQWFSVDLAGQAAPDWSQLGIAGVRVLAEHAHRRKLKRGALQGNRFVLTLDELEGEREALEARLQQVREWGVPNYFGGQRFGREGDNLDKAEALFAGRIKVKDRHRHGLYLSAARSFLFNTCLAARVADGSWQRALAGEVLMLAGTRGFFVAEQVDETIEARLAAMDIHPSGPLWGRGTAPSGGEALAREQACLQAYPSWCAGLERAGLTQERRALRLAVADLEWDFLAGGLELRFSLPAGCYATSVVRELARVHEDAPED